MSQARAMEYFCVAPGFNYTGCVKALGRGLVLGCAYFLPNEGGMDEAGSQ
jgi:hypothetical protein